MKNDREHKLYVGFGGFMVRVPPWLSNKGAKRGQIGAKANADGLSKTERRVHHFIVEEMAVAMSPITAEQIAHALGLANDQVLDIINKLEKLKTFVYRSDGQGINWAYPISLEDAGFTMRADSGEQFFAA
jgi:hypothetical protein